MKREITNRSEFNRSVRDFAARVWVMLTVFGVASFMLGVPGIMIAAVPMTGLVAVGGYLLGRKIVELIRRPVQRKLQAEVDMLLKDRRASDARFHRLNQDVCFLISKIDKERVTLGSELIDMISGPGAYVTTMVEKSGKKPVPLFDWGAKISEELHCLRSYKVESDVSSIELARAIASLQSDKRKGDKAIMFARTLIETVFTRIEPDETKRKAALYDATVTIKKMNNVADA